MKFHRSDDIVIRYKIKVKEDMADLRIVDYIPACFEYSGMKMKYHLYDIKPYKNYGVVKNDEKIFFHIPHIEKGVYNIYYILKAKFAGKYYLPGFTVVKGRDIIFSYPEDDYVTIL